MLKNYVLIAYRNIARQKFYSALNILGLSIGIAGFILISLWMKDELSYDRHFKNADRIYRIETSLVTMGTPQPMSATDPRIAEHIRTEYPEIENIVRIVKMPGLLTAADKKLFEGNTYYADSTFFNIFSYTLTSGNAHTALMYPGSIAITESIAAKLFGDADPIGKTIAVNNSRTKENADVYHVTAVMKDDVRPSHFHPKAVMAKFKRMETFEPTYILFKKGTGPDLFTNKIWKELYVNYFKADYQKDGQDVLLNRLQPLTEIHLSGNKWEELETNGNIMLVYIFSGIGMLILAIACINYVNLATARSLGRAAEVGVRKVLGATRWQLIAQFITESVILSLAALLLALAFVEMTLPSFTQLSEKDLTLQMAKPATILATVCLSVFVGVISGIYPAFYLSSFQPIKSLRPGADNSKNKPALRKVLVILQFSLSIVILIATMVIGAQLDFVKRQKLGFDTDRMLLVDLADQNANANKQAMKQALLKNPNILRVSTSFNIPGSELNHTFISFETNTGELSAKLVNSMYVDYDYVQLMGLELIQGKGFDSSMLSGLDTAAYIIVNQAALKLLGWTNAIGKKIETGYTYGLRKGYCVGVVRDFHASSLHDTISPMVLALGTLGRPMGKANFLTVKLRNTDMKETIDYIENVYKAYGQGYPFKYSFLEEQFNLQYKKEEKQKTLFDWFAGLSIFISCLGLIGLASFATKQRTKEICIRKISGASVTDIVILLTVDFIKLVLIAFVIATPTAYFTMNKWLQNFAYHIDLGPSYFLFAGAITTTIVIATIGIQSAIAARRDPAAVLKYE